MEGYSCALFSVHRERSIKFCLYIILSFVIDAVSELFRLDLQILPNAHVTKLFDVETVTGFSSKLSFQRPGVMAVNGL